MQDEISLKNLNDLPLFKALGFEVTCMDETSVQIRLDEKNECYGGAYGVSGGIGINGSVICAALEAAIGLCGHSSLGGQPAGVIEFSAKILRIVRGGSPVIEATIDRKNHSLAFVSAKLINTTGTICATASGICCVAGKNKYASYK